MIQTQKRFQTQRLSKSAFGPDDREARMELAFQIQDLGDNFQVLDSDARALKICV